MTAPNSLSAASHKFLSTALRRSARNLTWAADSSPEIYSEIIFLCALSAATLNRRVDFPTPGSPANKIAAPGTKPPPSTRSNSDTPELLAFALSKLTSPIGRAAAVTGPATSDNFLGAATSSTDPHAWHSPHRPTHLVLDHPHSLQRNGSFASFFTLATGRD